MDRLNRKTVIHYLKYLVIGLLAVLMIIQYFYIFGINIKAFANSLFFVAMLVVFFMDLKFYTIPDVVNIFIALLGIVHMFVGTGSIVEHLLGAFVISVPVYMVTVITGGFGGGDIKLFASVGLFLGWKMICLTAIIAILIGGVVGVVLLILKKCKIKGQIPFGPFIVVGSIISSLYGESILVAYGNWIML